MSNTRELNIKREKRFVGGMAKTYLYVDGENYGNIVNGKVGAVDIDFSAHKVFVVYDDGQGHTCKSNEIIIPANDLPYFYHLTLKMGLFAMVPTLTEDEAAAAKISKILQERQEFNKIKSQVDSVFAKIHSEEHPIHGYNYELVNTLPEYCLNSSYYRDYAKKLIGQIADGILNAYFNQKIIAIDKIYNSIRDMANILRVDKTKFIPLRHYDYMITQNNMINSVLSDTDTISDLQAIINRETLERMPDDVFTSNSRGEELYKQGKRQAAINCILYVDFSSEIFDEMKRWLIFTATIEGNDQEATTLHNQIRYMNNKAFARYGKENNKITQYLNVDMLISEALRLSKTKSFNDINDTLNDFLTFTAIVYDVENSQYNILQKVFAYLNAYEQEQMVLEAMVANRIVRSAEQEERLNFLKSKKSNGTVVVDAGSSDIQDEDGDKKFIYEYRSVSWNEKEVREYFDALTMQNQTTKLPFVVGEWTKTINVNGIKWDVKLVADKIDNALKETFDEKFHIVIPSSSPTGSINEYDYTILIADVESNGYNWIGFQVSGEQIMKNQITLSIYTMYMTLIDRLSDNIIERNKEICNKILLLKQKQNPRINTYTQTITDILVKELEDWINSQSETDIYN